MRATTEVRRFVRNPRAYARQDRIAGTLLLFMALVAIAALRRRALPGTQRDWITLAGAAVAMVAVANFAPDFVFWVVGVALVVSLIQNAETIADVFAMGQRRVTEALEAVA